MREVSRHGWLNSNSNRRPTEPYYSTFNYLATCLSTQPHTSLPPKRKCFFPELLVYPSLKESPNQVYTGLPEFWIKLDGDIHDDIHMISLSLFADGQIKPKSVDFLRHLNRQTHRTSDFEIPNLIIRRGQQFDLNITFDRTFSCKDDQLILKFVTGMKINRSPVCQHRYLVTDYA